MRQIQFIQIGVGNRGAHVLQEILTQYGDSFVPVALVDVNAATQRPGLAQLPTYSQLADALTHHPQAEAVVVVTPARLHGAMVRQALLAQKHVWVEKPLTYDYAEAQALAALAQQQQRVVVIGNQYQYHPLERQLQQLLGEERYGKAFFVSYLHHRHRPEMRAFTGEYPALWEQGVHSLNSILALLGNPDLKSVYAAGLRPAHSQYNSDTVTNVLTTFTNGAQAHLLVTFDSQRSDWSIRVECERAALLLQADGWERRGIEVLAGEQVIERITPVAMTDPLLRDPYSAFYTAVTTGQSTPTSISVNLKTIQWIDAAVQSLRTGQVVMCA
jgi:UDP-2-acetamido-3-amino-2,3-dideoxy-glucuronate N-acetyltransferase